MIRRGCGLLLLACPLLAAGCGGEPAAPPPVAAAPVAHKIDYRREILPILAGKCFPCHGPDQGARKSGLRLDQRDPAVRPARSGAIPIVPGKASDSEVVRRIRSRDDEERMPPAGSKHALTEAEKELLARWIDQGAEYSPHWALVPPVRPAVPAVKDARWVKNEIDAFVRARLENAGLRPSPPADPYTLIRRLSLDLTGLPPSLQEVDEFVAAASANPQAATEALVDRLLRSLRYGEKMAQLWLDLARFGDTSGYHQDSTRQMWLWRDGVIDAFNCNQPFDQFTIEQLAGDLLPGATIAQKIASGFNRNTRFNEEGGVDPEEFVLHYNADRVNALGQVWLGLTLSCAECHDHKYDPISQKEYYQFVAYFSGIKEPMVSMNHDQPLPPLLKVPRPGQAEALAKLQQEEASLAASVARELQRVKYDDPRDGSAEQSQHAWEQEARTDEKLPRDVQTALKAETEKRTAAQEKLLREYYLLKVHAGTREQFEPLDEELESLRKKIQAAEGAIPHTMVCEEMEPPRPTHVLIRGDFQRKGENVERAVPAALPPLPPDAPNNRLGLARWLVRAEHPLTARVTVNRLWAQMFGTGLVRTLGDFGNQGDYPSHPELLDWLASEFVASGWDVKALLRKIALSNAYRQSSAYRQERNDPENRLLYRAPRYRLSAEEIRDSALAVSELLDARIGGPSVKPYQPADFYKGKYEKWTWTPSAGEEQYRRGLYTFWRRMALHPMFALFDAPSREETCVARPRTNTPLQALVTLNDPTFVEAARVFAQRILLHGPGDLDGRLTFLFRTALARPPTLAELQALREGCREEHERYRRDADAASKLVSVGAYPRAAQLDVAEHAAWTAVATMLLNLDEFVMRE